MNTDKLSETKATEPPTTAKGQEAALLSDILQLPEPRFRGRIDNTCADSEADIISLPTAPAGAPNMLVILLDDVGLGQTSTFGGPLHVLMREDVSETTFEDWVTQHQAHAIRGGDTMSHLLDRRKMLLVSFVCALLFVLHFASPYARGQAAPPAKGQAAAAPVVQYQAWTGDFDGMLQRRFIRVLVSSSKTQYYVVHGVQHGSSYEYFKEFEQWVNLKYPPKVKNTRFHVVFVPVPRDQMFPRLAAGKGDLAAGALTITPARLKLVDFSDPLVTDVKEIAVTGPRSPVIHSLDDLSGQEVFVRKSSSYWEHLEALNSRFKSQGKASVKLRAAPEDLEDEDLLEMLNAGLIPVVVTNAYLPNLLQKIYTNIRPVPEAVLDDSGQIAWAMRRNSPKLAGVINQFVKTHKQGTAFGNAVIGRYALNPKMLKNAVAPAELRKFQETVSFFQKYAAEYNVDYLLMMAQGFQESTLNQEAKSSVGAVGIMQLMPATGEQMRVGDIHQKEANIHAGVKYIRFMVDKYFANEPMEDTNRLLFAFAAYNAGPGRIHSLRMEAPRKGLDANVWLNNVEMVAGEKIGMETVTYVANIYKYYVAYKLVAQREEERKKAKESLENGP